MRFFWTRVKSATPPPRSAPSNPAATADAKSLQQAIGILKGKSMELFTENEQRIIDPQARFLDNAAHYLMKQLEEHFRYVIGKDKEYL